jgi:iron complex outermembrane receptor protein
MGPATLARAQDAASAEQISLESLLDIVVTATLREQTTLDAPASITVVNAETIGARGYRSIKQILNDVVGFNDVSDTNEEIVGVRGVFASTSNKTLVLVNGHRMNDLMLGRYNMDQYLGIESIERVEFIKGPASALYGTGALVGVINIITKKGADLAGTQLRAQGGVYGQEVSASWGKQLVGYDVFFNVTYLNALGQEVAQEAALDVAGPGRMPQDGKIYLGRYRENASGLLTLRSEASELALRAAHFRRVPPRGSNGSFFDYDNEPFKPAYTENDFLIDYSYQFTFGQNKLKLNPSFHYFGYYEQSFITFGANDAPPLGQRSGTLGEYNQYRLLLTYERQIFEPLNVIAGLDPMLSTFYRSDAWSIRPNADRIDVFPNGYTQPGKWFLFGGFAQLVYSPVKQVTLTAGGRYDTFQGEADAKFTPRVGVVYKPWDYLAAKVLYGQSYLAPMWSHKRANDGNFQGTPNLRPESFEGGDFIVQYGTKRTTASVDVFYNKVTDLINAVRQSQDRTSPLFSKQNYLNQGEMLYYGVEVAGESQILPWLKIFGSYSYIRPDSCSAEEGAADAEAFRAKNAANEAVFRTGQTPPDLNSPVSITCGTSPGLYVRGRDGTTPTDDIFIKDISHHTMRYGFRLDPIPNLQLSVWGRFYSDAKTVDPIVDPMDAVVDVIPAVAIIDASASYTWRALTFQVLGYNLTDRYYERGGTVARPLARMGLTLEGAISAKF